MVVTIVWLQTPGIDTARRQVMMEYAAGTVEVRKLSSIVCLPLLPSEPADADTAATGLLAGYCGASPEAAELFAAWDCIKKRTSRAMINLLDFFSVLVKWGDSDVALAVCRKILRSKHKALFSQLGSEHGRLIISTLTLLACIGQRTPGTARELLSRFNFGSRIFQRLTSKSTGNKGRGRGRMKDVAKARVEEVRDSFAQLVLALLRVPAPDVQRQLVNTKGLIRGVVHLVASSTSGTSLPIVALSTLLQHVLRNPGIPSDAKRRVFDSSALEVLTRLYASAQVVREAVHAFLLVVCCGEKRPDHAGSSRGMWSAFGSPPRWDPTVTTFQLNSRLRMALRFVISLNVRGWDGMNVVCPLVCVVWFSFARVACKVLSAPQQQVPPAGGMLVLHVVVLLFICFRCVRVCADHGRRAPEGVVPPHLAAVPTFACVLLAAVSALAGATPIQPLEG